jgi:hypothetical protein
MGRCIDTSALIIVIRVKIEQACLTAMLQICIWQAVGLNLTQNTISPDLGFL